MLDAIQAQLIGRRTLGVMREALTNVADVEHFDPLDDEFGFVIVWNQDKTSAYATFIAYQVDSIGEDVEIDGDEVQVTGYIRFDGCSNLNFGDGGYLHWCGGLRTVEAHAALLRHLFEVAEQRMKASDGHGL